ncbi:MAG: hypothetical protein AB7P76_04540 [Candidatus Melainabacteria bacterium]
MSTTATPSLNPSAGAMAFKPRAAAAPVLFGNDTPTPDTFETAVAEKPPSRSFLGRLFSPVLFLLKLPFTLIKKALGLFRRGKEASETPPVS